MDIGTKSCRLCLSESEFNVSLFGSYCRKTNMIDKILVCLKIPIEDEEYSSTICYRCAHNVEKYYNFLNEIKKSQARLGRREINMKNDVKSIKNNLEQETVINIQCNRRQITSYTREQMNTAANYLEAKMLPEKKMAVQDNSSPLFSYFPQQNSFQDSLICSQKDSFLWATPKPRSSKYCDDKSNSNLNMKQFSQNRTVKTQNKPFQQSGDLFASQSQNDDLNFCVDWKLTPDENFMKKLRNKHFGNSDF